MKNGFLDISNKLYVIKLCKTSTFIILNPKHFYFINYDDRRERKERGNNKKTFPSKSKSFVFKIT